MFLISCLITFSQVSIILKKKNEKKKGGLCKSLDHGLNKILIEGGLNSNVERLACVFKNI